MQLTKQDEINIDLEIIDRLGLLGFMKCAWPLIEVVDFVDNWHIGAICAHLEAVALGEIRNLLICVPPGFTKTITTSVLFPAWNWTETPGAKYITSTYSQTLSNRSAKQHRDLVKSEWYQERWPHVKIARKSLEQVREFENTAHGFRFSTSVGGEVTGRHADYLIFDDLVKAQDAEGRVFINDKSAIEKANHFWFRTMATREANPKTTRRIGIMQRLHVADTAGKCIESGKYEALVLPQRYEKKYHCSTKIFEDPRTEEGELLCPERVGEEEADERKESMGALAYAAQEQQRPVAIEGGVYSESMIQHWRPEQLPASFSMVIQSWDMSFKNQKDNDFVASEIWGVSGSGFYLLDIIIERMSFTDACRKMIAMARKWPEAFKKIIEDAANGPAVADFLQSTVSGIELVRPKGGKEARAWATQPLWEAGNVWLPPVDHPYTKEFVKQHLEFPNGPHDDAVDAQSQALLLLATSPASKFEAGMTKIMAGYRSDKEAAPEGAFVISDISRRLYDVE